jgi:hypothetical protein
VLTLILPHGIDLKEFKRLIFMIKYLIFTTFMISVGAEYD